MPVQYVMIYLNKEYWNKFEKLDEKRRKKIKKQLQQYLYRKLDKNKEQGDRNETP